MSNTTNDIGIVQRKSVNILGQLSKALCQCRLEVQSERRRKAKRRRHADGIVGGSVSILVWDEIPNFETMIGSRGDEHR